MKKRPIWYKKKKKCEKSGHWDRLLFFFFFWSLYYPKPISIVKLLVATLHNLPFSLGGQTGKTKMFSVFENLGIVFV